jgi:hypothetical protein
MDPKFRTAGAYSCRCAAVIIALSSSGRYERDPSKDCLDRRTALAVTVLVRILGDQDSVNRKEVKAERLRLSGHPLHWRRR